MAILEQEVLESNNGFAKEIEESAMPLAMDVLQVTHYTFPFKSTIRELVSNAVDAVREKNIAIQILSGAASEEEFYIHRDERIFADSNFLPEYYDLQWLRGDDIVRIEYKENVGSRDILTIKDQGVGIGDVKNPTTGVSRLQGYFKLLYSTKRNSTKALGKYGLGAKAALSTADYYTVTTRHNGKEYQFNVYKYKVDSVIPRFDLQTGKENPSFVFNEGTDKVFKGYYRETSLPNGTEIQVEAKRHNRREYINAVLSQLLYFDNIEFKIVRENGWVEEVPVKAKVYYEDEDMILSDNNQFSKPHLVLNGVNYGYVNFLEMELEEKVGNIALKVRPEDVEVTPSRETLIWNAKTRKAVLSKFEKVTETASRIIQEKLTSTDLVQWIKDCTAALGDNTTQDTVAGKLAGIINKEDITPSFTPLPKVKYFKNPNKFFKGCEVTLVSAESFTGTVKIKRERVNSWAAINHPVVFQAETTSSKKDLYLTNFLGGPFLKIRVLSTEDKSKEEEKEDANLELIDALTKSQGIIIYEDVEVPENAKDPDKEEGINKLSPMELRAIQQRTVLVYPEFINSYNPFFKWTKHEPKIIDIVQDTDMIVYGFQEDEDLLKMLAGICSDWKYREGRYSTQFVNTGVKSYGEFLDAGGRAGIKIYRIAKSAAKFYKSHVYVKDLIMGIDYENQSINMYSAIRDWYTATLIHKELERMKFLENFSRFDSEISQLYKELCLFTQDNYQNLYRIHNDDKKVQELTEYIAKVAHLQLFIEENKGDHDMIAEYSRNLFEIPKEEATFKAAIGLNLEIYQKLQKVLDYIRPLETIFNEISVLCSNGMDISAELEVEIKEIMRTKGII